MDEVYILEDPTNVEKFMCVEFLQQHIVDNMLELAEARMQRYTEELKKAVTLWEIESKLYNIYL